MVYHHETSSSELQRRKRSLAKHRAYVEGRNQSEDTTRSGGCLRKSMYVSFESIGWSPWIIAPKGYDAYRCNGGCPFNPRSTEDHTWSNYAKVKAIMNRRKRGVSPPCCVPSEFHPLGLTILYLEPETRNIVLTELPDMIVAKCGCRWSKMTFFVVGIFKGKYAITSQTCIDQLSFRWSQSLWNCIPTTSTNFEYVYIDKKRYYEL